MTSSNFPSSPFQTDTSVHWRHTFAGFRELGYAPISVKFPPIVAPHVLYTFMKKNLKYFQNFFSYSCFDILKLYSCEKTFLNLFYFMFWTIFHLFQYCNFTTGLLCKNFRRKKVRKNDFEFFLTVHFRGFFRIFFRIFFHIWCYISVSFTDVWKI